MKIFTDINEWLNYRPTLANRSIGLVPTMGNLHRGHQSLVHRSVCENDCTVASIFVNPTQFNQQEDFTQYPRTVEADLDLLQQSGVDYCLIPNAQDIYHQGYDFSVHESNLSLSLEGAHRPGHFDGVMTVVIKLFNLILPQKAYFGEKDYQQYLLIKSMVADFFMNIDIIACPTIREASGLAYSSRNNRLTLVERQQAEKFAACFLQKMDCASLLEALANLPIAVDYLMDVANRRYIAVRIGTIRLIDNYSLA